MPGDHRHPVPPDIDRKSRLNCADEWRALVRTRANVLVTGPEEALEGFLRTVRSELREPIRSVVCGPALSFERASTLILREVHQLDEIGQRALLAWMNRSERAATQIVSVTSLPLFALARANRFDRDLYYYLNTIYLEMGGAGNGVATDPAHSNPL